MGRQRLVGANLSVEQVFIQGKRRGDVAIFCLHIRSIVGYDVPMYNSPTPGFLGATGLPVSRLGLGTAEIGFAYGLGNPLLPNESDALELLTEAVRLGVTFFDTANYYGLAEERIGKSGILKDTRVVVCTKCAQFLEQGEYFSPEVLEQKIRAQIESSRKNLGLDVLPLVLIHGPSKEQVEEGVLIHIMETLRAEGKLRVWGASTRGIAPPQALMARDVPVLELAYNVADKRMDAVLQEARQKNVGIINRSVYLKGVFAGKAALLPDTLLPLKNIVQEAESCAQEAGIPLWELALRYTLSEPAIHTTLVGTAKKAHLLQAVEAFAKGPLPKDICERLRVHASADALQVDPAEWPK